MEYLCELFDFVGLFVDEGLDAFELKVASFLDGWNRKLMDENLYEFLSEVAVPVIVELFVLFDFLDKSGFCVFLEES